MTFHETLFLAACALVITGCGSSSSGDESNLGTNVDSTSDELVAAPGQVAWKNLEFHGSGCNALFPATATANGGDAGFLPGVGADLGPNKSVHVACDMSAFLMVPRGYYPVKFSYSMSYGFEKPAGARLRIASDFFLRLNRGFGDIDIAPPTSVDVEEPMGVKEIDRDVSASKRHFCDLRTDSRVRFDNFVLLQARSASVDLAASVDSVDLHAEIAPCR
jgi:hypothetical protein